MFRFITSVARSIGRGIRRDPEVRRAVERHPWLFGFLRRRLDADAVFGLHLTVGIAITVFAAYQFFGVIEDYLGHQALIQADLRLINLVQLLRTPKSNALMLAVTDLGQWQVVLLGTLLTAAVLWLQQRWYQLIGLLLSVGGGEALVWLIKHAIARPRPPLTSALLPEDSFSFPSGHAFVALAFYGFLVYLVVRSARRRWHAALAVAFGLLLVLAIGWSRIYLGVHWPSDILGSYALGVAWLAAIITAVEIRQAVGHAHREPHQPRHLTAVRLVALALWAAVTVAYISTHTHPIPAAVAATIPAEVTTLGQLRGVFRNVPATSESIIGTPMEPINVIVVASRVQLEHALRAAGWALADRITPQTATRLSLAWLLHVPYPEAPGVPSFWNARPNDFAFEQTTPQRSVHERHHIHFWSTPFILADGRPVWFATAHFDRGVKIRKNFGLPTHTIDPAVDKERQRVKDELLNTGLVASVEEFSLVEPQLGNNASGDSFFTDGKVAVISLTPESQNQ